MKNILFLSVVLLSKNLYAVPRFISHAGGFYNGMAYTNSKESFQETYKAGYRCLEVDLRRTSDNQTVLIHDWQQTWEQHFGGQPDHTPTAQEFLTKQPKFTQMKMTDFFDLVRKMEGLDVILDIKEDVVSILNEIHQKAPDLQERLLPQIFTEEQFLTAQKLGFSRNILALYRMGNIDTQSLEKFYNKYHPIGFTISKERVLSSHYQPLLAKYPTFVFTVNSQEIVQQLSAYPHVSGIFTDRLELVYHKDFHQSRSGS